MRFRMAFQKIRLDLKDKIAAQNKSIDSLVVFE
jgi:hypothetical protein